MSCAFKGCTNSVHLCKDSGLKFFKFPTLPFIRSKWLEACDGNEENLPKVPRICSTHFALTDITTSKNKTILCRSAVPQKTRTQFGKTFGNEEYLDEYMEYLDGQEDATTSETTSLSTLPTP